MNIFQCQNHDKVMRKGSVNNKTPNQFDYPATKPISKLNFSNHQENEFETEESRPSVENIVSLFKISLKIIQIIIDK